MTNEKLEDDKIDFINIEQPIEKIEFISTDEDEQEGNFEFLCCRGGGRTGMAGGGGRW